MDLSGAGNHVTEVGGTSIDVARPVGAPAYIYGASTAWMRFPEGILPSATYTLLYVARYNGPSQQRIFNGVSLNWLSGFHSLKIGVAHHGASCAWITPTPATDSASREDWLFGSDRSNSFRMNGIEMAFANGCATFTRIAVNTESTERSDFAIRSLLVYNVKLSDAEVQQMEAWIQGACTQCIATANDASIWMSNSAIRCKLSAG